MLTLLILLPILGIVHISLYNTFTVIPTSNNNNAMNIGISYSLLVLFLSFYMWLGFDNTFDGYQYLEEYQNSMLTQYHFYLGVDGLNIFFVLLTTFITPIALLSNYSSFNKTNNSVSIYVACFLLLETLQLMTFVSLDLFMFYVFFESVLPVLFVIIIVYGSGQNKIRSAYLLFLYTLFGSLFMLLAILVIYNYTSTTDFLILSLNTISLENQIILFIGFLIAFSVKTPLWPLAAWLYRAHADSPLAGSILLAGTILKLATYGFMRISLSLLPDASFYFGPLVQTIAVISLIYASLSTIIQEDTKVLVAYSSIAHMAVVILGLFSNTVIGIEGAILLSIAHGFVSPALFLCVGGVLYDSLHTREIKSISGVVTYMPIFSLFFFIFILANTAIPLTLNFIGEQLALIGTWESNPIIAILGATGILLSACYSISFFNKLVFGGFTLFKRWNVNSTEILHDVNRRELTLLITLLIPTIILGILPNIILDSLHSSITQLIYNV